MVWKARNLEGHQFLGNAEDIEPSKKMLCISFADARLTGLSHRKRTGLQELLPCYHAASSSNVYSIVGNSDKRVLLVCKFYPLSLKALAM